MRALHPWNEQQWNPAHDFVCEVCGKPGHRRMSGTSKAKGYTNRFCSMECRLKHHATQRSLRPPKMRPCPRPRAIRMAPCPKPLRICECGQASVPKQAHRCTDCQKLRDATHRREARRKHRQTPEGKASKAAEKAKRRASQRIQADRFNPIDIFERDKWRCQLCGCKTPKDSRGTYADNAPELDHVVTLADGGNHTRANTQCACRKCNMAKGRTSKGQIGLDLGV